jgi:hypothetical protein
MYSMWKAWTGARSPALGCSSSQAWTGARSPALGCSSSQRVVCRQGPQHTLPTSPCTHSCIAPEDEHRTRKQRLYAATGGLLPPLEHAGCRQMWCSHALLGSTSPFRNGRQKWTPMLLQSVFLNLGSSRINRIEHRHNIPVMDTYTLQLWMQAEYIWNGACSCMVRISKYPGCQIWNSNLYNKDNTLLPLLLGY